jgi:hypothetical protein
MGFAEGALGLGFALAKAGRLIAAGIGEPDQRRLIATEVHQLSQLVHGEMRFPTVDARPVAGVDAKVTVNNLLRLLDAGAVESGDCLPPSNSKTSFDGPCRAKKTDLFSLARTMDSVYVQTIPCWYLEPENDPEPSAEIFWLCDAGHLIDHE